MLTTYKKERIEIYNRHMEAVHDIKSAICVLANNNKAVAELLESLLSHVEKARKAEFCLRQDCMTKEEMEELENYLQR